MLIKRQFDLRRLLTGVTIVAFGGGLFACLSWPVALLAVAAINGVAAIGFAFGGRRRIAGLALVTCALILATLFFTDWGLSRQHGVVRIAWPFLIAACVAQTTTIISWLFS